MYTYLIDAETSADSQSPHNARNNEQFFFYRNTEPAYRHPEPVCRQAGSFQGLILFIPFSSIKEVDAEMNSA